MSAEATTRAALAHIDMLLDLMAETDAVYEPDEAEAARSNARAFLDAHKDDLEAYQNDLAEAEERAGEVLQAIDMIESLLPQIEEIIQKPGIIERYAEDHPRAAASFLRSVERTREIIKEVQGDDDDA